MKNKNKKNLKKKLNKAFKPKTIEGTVRGNKKGFAFLDVENSDKDFFIPRSKLNGAQHLDKVKVKIEKGDEVKVVSIKERGISELVGVFCKAEKGGYVKADDSDFYTKIYLSERDLTKVKDGDKGLLKIVGYNGDRAEGKLLEVLGKAGVKDTEILAILKNHGFDNKFSEEVKMQAKSLQRKIINRVDFTSLKTITIDGDDAKDLDDAISLEKLSDNKFRLYVHIADVSSYVDMDSPIDKRAAKYTTSVYFPECVYPMLPEELSNVACSLNEGEEKDTLTVIMEIDENGEVVNSDIKESLIKSSHRMTYKKVAAILNGDKKIIEEYSDIIEMIRNMEKLSDILVEKRKKRGALFFKSKECVINLNDKGEPENLNLYEYTKANEIIEEFMLVANETIAKTFLLKEAPFVYRVHAKPKDEKIESLRFFVQSCGLNMSNKLNGTAEIRKLLEDAKGSPFENIINDVALRSMQKARYSVTNDGHYGLQAEYYCHFTSPIRRYPDLMIHRIIKSYINGKITPGLLGVYKRKALETAINSTEKEIAAETAEREIDEYYKIMYMKNHIGEEFTGRISGVQQFGIFVELDNTIEGMVKVEDLPGGDYIFDKKSYTLKGGENKFKLGDEVKVKLHSCDLEERHINFMLAE